MSLRLIASLFFISLAALGFTDQSAIWQKIGTGIDEPAVVKMAVHPHDPSIIFAGTAKALYQSSDGGRRYKVVFQTSGINDIYIDPKQPRNVYAATDAGLYESRDGGNHWQRIYYSSDAQSRRCLALTRAGEILYLGTGKGLFYQSVHETTWSAVGSELSRKSVSHIAAGGRFLYFAAGDALYDLDLRTNGYSRVFTAGSGGVMIADEDVSEEEAGERLVRFVRVADDDDTVIYAATARGIYLSGDKGRHWRLLANPPIALETLNAFLILGEDEDRRLLVGTKGGAFSFDDGRWTPLYQGMETNGMNDLAKDARGTVYAATERGVFYLSSGQALSPFPSEEHFSADKLFREEPTIQQVHQWAIEYAEVDPDKIKSWRSLARKRAFLPDVSVGVDRAADNLLHWDSGGNPDNLLKGRDYVDWDVSVSWDLADLVWSSDQTTIDSRSKLMVELREDVLDQVTRLYFERRRLQAELAADSLEPPARFDKELRVEELTALLDAFTGGEFGRRLAPMEEVKK